MRCRGTPRRLRRGGGHLQAPGARPGLFCPVVRSRRSPRRPQSRRPSVRPAPRTDRDTSAYPRPPVSDEGSGTCRIRGTNGRGVSGHSVRANHRDVAGLDDQPNGFVVAHRLEICYGIGEMPAPNREGAVTNTVCSSHGNDTDSDGACVTGPQPYSERENERFAGMLPVPSECGLEPERAVSAGRASGGRMPRPSGRGGGHVFVRQGPIDGRMVAHAVAGVWCPPTETRRAAAGPWLVER